MNDPATPPITVEDLDPGFVDEIADDEELRKLHACLTCGGCASGCMISYLGKDYSPRTLARMLILGMKERSIDSDFIWVCTMCERCTQGCPMGINMGKLIRKIRTIRVARGTVPQGLQTVVDDHVRTGNNMAVSTEDFVETCEWIEEELQDELEDPSVKIPIDKQGARVFYTLNPREIKFFPLTLAAAAKIYHAAGEDWTLCTNYWDVTNYALFNGDNEAARDISQRCVSTFRDMGCQVMVAAECGHGYQALAHRMEGWLGEKLEFPIVAFTELVADYIREGRIKLDPTVNDQPVTFHDPCNLVRKGGVVQAPRYCLRHAVMDFREMEPHGIHNYCCGGGGGALSTHFVKQRIAAGERKAAQVRATGAKILSTTCHNCLDQLADIKKHYKLDVQIKTVGELVADALIMD